MQVVRYALPLGGRGGSHGDHTFREAETRAWSFVTRPGVGGSDGDHTFREAETRA
jgi:hypothetical protein